TRRGMRSLRGGCFSGCLTRRLRLPSRVRIERVYGAWQPLEREAREHRRGEPAGIDFEDALGSEKLVEAGAEVAARLQHDGAESGDVEAEAFEPGRVRRLDAAAYDDDGQSVGLDRGGGTEIGGAAA